MLRRGGLGRDWDGGRYKASCQSPGASVSLQTKRRHEQEIGMMNDYTTRDPIPTNRDPRPTHNFPMCKYCGQRIVQPFDHAGNASRTGVYCSRGCSEVANPGNGAADTAADTNIRRRIAASVDPRLPSIILWLADGETQQEVSNRLGISPQAVSQLIKRLRSKSAAPCICAYR